MDLTRSRQQNEPVELDFDEGHKDYTYVPLKENEIRLLNLKPGRRNTELKASLEIYPLYEGKQDPWELRPPYEALSYFWGERTPTPFDFSINIIEHSENFRIFIRPNLESALRHLRSLKHPRYLWIDALCINQKDDQTEQNEKNIQIPRMHLIYNKAKSVCIWLGPADEPNTSDEAMEHVDAMINLETLNNPVKKEDQARLLANFARLLRRPWFNRRWIVQEVAIARAATVCCGSKVVSWEKFAGAISLFASKHIDLKAIFKESRPHGFDPDYLGDVRELGAYRLVHAASNFFRKSDSGDILENLVSLEEVVSMLTAFDAKDPRDVIYAVLSLSRNATASAKHKSAFAIDKEVLDDYFDKKLSNPPSPVKTAHTMDEEPEALPLRRVTSDWRVRATLAEFFNRLRGKKRPSRIITINYKSSPFDVYRDFLEHTILHSNSVDILCRPWAANVEGLPSWISKKTGAVFGYRSNRAYSRIKADLLVGSASAGGKHYSASGENSSATWDYRPDDALTRSLVVQGFVLDTIERKHVPAMGGVIPAEWYKEWERVSHSTHDSAFWRTLAADRGPEGQKPPPSYYKLACAHAFDHRVNQGYLDTREMMRDCPSIVEDFLQRVQAVTWMRRLILSRKHQRLGLAPYETKKKDLICVLQGCSVPVILRRRETTYWIREELAKIPSENEPPTINIEDSGLSSADDDANSANEAFGGEVRGGVSADSSVIGRATEEANEEKERNRQRRLHLNAALAKIELSLRQEREAAMDPRKTASVQAVLTASSASRLGMPSPSRRRSTGSSLNRESTTITTTAKTDKTSSENLRSGLFNGSSKFDINPDRSSGSGPDLDTAGLSQPSYEASSNEITTAPADAATTTPRQTFESGTGIPPATKRSLASDLPEKSLWAGPAQDTPDNRGESVPPPPPPPPPLQQQQQYPNLDSSAIVEPRKLDHSDRTSTGELWKEQPLPKYFYEFVGECYIHGMMDGEAMRFARGSVTRKEAFNPLQGERQAFWLR